MQVSSAKLWLAGKIQSKVDSKKVHVLVIEVIIVSLSHDLRRIKTDWALNSYEEQHLLRH